MELDTDDTRRPLDAGMSRRLSDEVKAVASDLVSMASISTEDEYVERATEGSRRITQFIGGIHKDQQTDAVAQAFGQLLGYLMLAQGVARPREDDDTLKH